MELTIEEAFRRGDQAYKEGNINEADKFFTAVLGVFPDHPLANYKLGIMAVEIGRASKAISLLEMATKADGSKLEFWLNYIDLLIKLGLRRDAKDALSQAKKNGHSGSNIEILDEKLSELSKAKSNSKQDVPLFENQKKFLYETKYTCNEPHLIPAFNPELCCVMKNNKMKCDYKRNCRCKNRKTGICESCYPAIKIKRT